MYSQPNQIYVLVDPTTNEPRYVGKTHQGLEKRLKMHMNWPSPQYPVGKWVVDLMSKGLAPEILELEHVIGAVPARDHERFWIRNFVFMGADLLNRQFNGGGNRAKPKVKCPCCGAISKIHVDGVAGFQVHQSLASRGSLTKEGGR